jgi:hypothetical protein
MIDLTLLAQDLEDRLNTNLKALYEAEDTPMDNGRVLLWFKVFTTANDYKKSQNLKVGKYPDDIDAFSDNYTGRVVQYIQSEMQQIYSDNENNGSQGINLFLNTQVSFKIPLKNKAADTTLEFAESVKKIIDYTFATNRNIIIRDDDTTYSIGVNYSLANTGARTQDLYVGDSVVMTAIITYSVIDFGLNSSKIEITFDGVPIKATNFGLCRALVNSAEIGSSENGASKHTIDGSTFTLSFVSPLRIDLLGDEIGAFILTKGKYKVAHLVNVKMPSSVPNTYIESDFLMCFSDVRINGEKTLNASADITMGEVLDIDGAITLSEYAQANWEG